jgi:signal peptidase I
MIPTLQVGDYFFASKWPYGYSRYSLPFAPNWFEGRIFAREPRRGDVVVFRNPKDNTDYVKRIVGLPGDEIQLKGARLFINGKVVERRAIDPGVAVRGATDKPIVAPTYDEYLPGGAVHRIIQLEGDDGAWSNTEVFATPPGVYFVLGDNRDNSVDSRMVPPVGRIGFVPFENLIGRADIIYYSAAADPATHPPRPRIERIGLGVR